ncbi:MAG TPA: energy transducer TonB [Bryobacteraceae bacterium]|nr:energy transducer TonB [Bryobacteraceae bacterium]
MKCLFLCSCFLAASIVYARADDPATLFQQARQTLEAPSGGDVDKAVSLLKRAAAGWQAASSNAPHYAAALDYLAVALMVQLREDAAAREDNSLADFREWIKRAGPYTKRALEIAESNPAVKQEDLALALELEAQLRGQQGSGAALWDRAAKIRAERVAALNPVDLALGPLVKTTEENTTEPHGISIVKPDYTRIAALAQYAGRVALKTTIGVDGKARDIQLLRGLGFGLDEQAAKALLQSKFQPGQKSGQPVSMSTEVQVEFRLN